MPFNGSGVYTLPAGNPVVTGTVISSTVQNNTMADVANNGLSNCITKDGQSTPTANIGFSGFRVMKVGDAIVSDDAAPAGQIQNGTIFLLGSVSGTDTITGTVTPPITSYVAGQMFRFVASGTNTTSSVTLNIGSIGAQSITKQGADFLSPGDIPPGGVIEVVYDGTQFQAVGGLSRSGSFPTGYRDLESGNLSFATTNAVIFHPGQWRSANDQYDLVLVSALTKVLQSSGSWTAGNNNNGLFSGAKANSTVYYTFIIRKDADGSLDAGYDTSSTAANIPSGYSAYRRNGAIRTDPSGNIFPFINNNDEMAFYPPLSIFTNAGFTAGWVAGANALVPAVPVLAKIRMAVNSGLALGVFLKLGPPGSSITPATGTGDIYSNGASTLTSYTELILQTALFSVYISTTSPSGTFLSLQGYRDLFQD